VQAFISRKKSFFIFLIGFAVAAGVMFLLNYYLAGPKLGRVYDFFLDLRAPQPVPREILIIKTSESAESGDVFCVLTALTEFDASCLILETGVSGFSSSFTGSKAEIREKFHDEYYLLGSNIRTLFDGIRRGSVTPVQAPQYIERLIELTEQGRDRLVSVFTDGDEYLFRSAEVFGNLFVSGERYSLDRDGKLRRVNPFHPEARLPEEAKLPVYQSLESRFASSQIESLEHGQVLYLLMSSGKEIDIPLDRDGNIIAGKPGAFRSVDIAMFREYEEKDRAMRRALIEADELGAFSQTSPDDSPVILGNYVFDFREEMFRKGNAQKRGDWIASRNDYLKSLDEFLYGPAEMNLVKGYEEVIAGEKSLSKEGIAKLTNMRDQLIGSFSVMREKHSELTEIHVFLRDEVFNSFCIMGTVSGNSNAEYSALLANALLTGNCIKPVITRYVFFFSIVTALIILLIIHRLRPLLVFSCGLVLSLLAAAVFGLSFTFSAYWLDPSIIFGTSLSGTLVIFGCKKIISGAEARRLHIAYGEAVSPVILRRIIRSGKPLVTETSVASAVVIAIKDCELLRKEALEKPTTAAKHKKTFYIEARKIIFNAGAVIAGCEGDIILCCFGSPLDLAKDASVKAYELIKKMSDKNQWRFGVDAGACSFSWSKETGFCVSGRAAVRAKVLASKTVRLKARALVTSAALTDIKKSAKRIGALHDENDFFYELPL
jgi:hypothetical protein